MITLLLIIAIILFLIFIVLAVLCSRVSQWLRYQDYINQHKIKEIRKEKNKSSLLQDEIINKYDSFYEEDLRLMNNNKNNNLF